MVKESYWLMVKVKLTAMASARKSHLELRRAMVMDQRDSNVLLHRTSLCRPAKSLGLVERYAIDTRSPRTSSQSAKGC